jgi:predicted ATPase/DNA-binding winged helix-turn-helix (wHTH) protein
MALSNDLETSLRAAEATDQQPGLADSAITFGPFRLHPARHLLLKDDMPVSIGARALEILIALVEHAGELVTKDQLVSRAWPNLVVEESNLRAQVANLRKALHDGRTGADYIAAVPGRGYRFVATILRSGQRLTDARSESRKNNLPARLTQVIGRADIIGALVSRLQRRRFVTIVGPGGIGKTTVALAIAAETLTSQEDGVWLHDLAPLSDSSLLPSVIASTLGLALTSHNRTEELIGLLRNKQMLLIFDSCERVVEAAADLVEKILKSAPSVRILTTSREPLRAEGESVHRLSPLETPPVMAGLTASSALSFPAVELFIERIVSNVDGFRLYDADAPLVADICRQLDGIPLAIELAAGRVDAFGVRGVAQGLDDRFRLLSGGRRTALPRHQALRATLDWSYDLLPDLERTLLRRLGAFVDGFTLNSVRAVATDSEIQDLVIADLLANLIAKSLVSSEIEGFVARYRLLDTTRAYTLVKLAESGELEAISRRHAEYFRHVFEAALSEWETRPNSEWLTSYGREIANMRTALDWAFSPSGDAELGIALTVAAIPLWFQLSSTEECRNRVEQALDHAAPGVNRDTHAREVMRLYMALGLSRTFTIGLAPQASAAWKKAFEIADSLGDGECRLEALWGLWFCHIGAGEYRAALSIAEQYYNSAETAEDRLIGHRLIGVPLHCLGDHARARGHIEGMLSRSAYTVKSSQGNRFRFDQPLAARVILAQMLWLQGFPDRAIEATHSSLDEAIATGHAISLCDALAQAVCPIAMLVGDLSAAEQAVTTLLSEATLHALDPWSVLGCCWKGALHIKRGELDYGLPLLRSALTDLREVRFAFYHAGFLGVLTEGFASAGQFEAAHGAIDEALEYCKQKEELWYIAELLRIKGEILLQKGDEGVPLAEEHFLRSGAWARQQAALSWELRAAISLARLRRQQGRVAEAREALALVYERFSEGFATTDLRVAKRLLDALSPSE